MKWVVQIFTLFAFISQAQATGQETWGGDTASLKFVKFARILSREAEETKGCLLKETLAAKKVSLETWNKKIDEIEVQSLEKNKSDEPGKIFINRLKWWNLPQSMKAEAVIAKYLQQHQITINEQQAITLIAKCQATRWWKRNSNISLAENSKPVIDLKKEILEESAELIAALKKNQITSRPEQLKVENLEKLLSDFQVSTERNRIQAQPLTFKFSDDSVKDGKNTVNKKVRDLVVNISAWKFLSRGQKKEFIYHELLGLLRFDDSKYQYSSKLFFDLDEKEYTH